MPQTVVGLFNSAAEAEQATQQLLAAGFQQNALQVATQDTLRAALPTDAQTAAPTEHLGTGFIRFFTDLFTGNENADAQAHIAATHADSAVLTVQADTPEAASRARALLDANGAVDVYRQPQASPGTSTADNMVDLEGSLSRVRDSNELDANGLTTH